MATITDLSVKTIEGQDRSLSSYQGKVLLVVNVASYCGYTPQYQGLQALHEKYSDRGLRILAFPCNDFGAQEPGSNEQIKTFCSTRYHVTFELFEKVHAKGADKHPLYERLTSGATPAGDVSWNFEKFLVGKTGEIIARFPSRIAPDSAELTGAIEQALGA